jgi:hypothetical protein
MGDEFVGIVHPCKIYNIMSIGAPTLYIGPTPSHVTDIASQQQAGFFLTSHGDVERVTTAILEAMQLHQRQPASSFGKHTLLPQLIDIIETRQVFQAFSSTDYTDSIKNSA